MPLHPASECFRLYQAFMSTDAFVDAVAQHGSDLPPEFTYFGWAATHCEPLGTPRPEPTPTPPPPRVPPVTTPRRGGALAAGAAALLLAGLAAWAAGGGHR